MLPTLMQWIHLSAAALAVGGIAFVVLVLMPALAEAEPSQRDLLLAATVSRFRWVVWTTIALLLVSGIYNTSLVWEAPWGAYWRLLTLKIVLAFAVFFVTLCLTLPLKFLERFRLRRRLWMTVALALAGAIILISAYLRRG